MRKYPRTIVPNYTVTEDDKYIYHTEEFDFGEGVKGTRTFKKLKIKTEKENAPSND